MVLWTVFMVFQVGAEIGGLKFIEIFILKKHICKYLMLFGGWRM